MVKRYGPILLIVCLLAATVYSLFGDESYGKLVALRKSLVAQQAANAELGKKVSELKAKVGGIRSDDRELEKTARNELGMARPNEMIFIFNDNDKGQASSAEASRRR